MASIGCVSYYSFKAVLTLVFLMFVVVAIPAAGGIFNRMRGGGIVDWSSLNETYWTSHLTGRAVMAVPTALLLIVVGFHFKASVLVGLLTWASLFIGWGTYFSIGSNINDFESRLGVFDWLLGRPDANWTDQYTRRFLREYTGMSLRGLLWTLPSGYILYILDFGWAYSLSGSLMASVYVLGQVFPDFTTNGFLSQNFNGMIGHSEFIWGYAVWYCLVVMCMVKLIKGRRVTLEKRYKRYKLSLDHKCFTCCSSDCKKIKCFRFIYEAIVVVLTLLFLCSVVYYAGVQQYDFRNKMQTFTGLFIVTVSLVFFLGGTIGYCIAKRQQRVKGGDGRRKQGHRVPNRNGDTEEAPLLESDHEVNTVVGYREVTAAAITGPDGRERGVVGVREVLMGSRGQGNTIDILKDHISVFDYYWILLETLFFLDLFGFMQFLIGIVSALFTMATLVLAVYCFIQNISTPRCLPPVSGICLNITANYK